MRLENVEDIYPLAPLQQGLLFHSLSAPEAGLYCNQALFTLNGRLDLPAFKRAWQRVVEHHPVLRAAFVWEGVKEPVQVVNRQVEFAVAHDDLRLLAPEAQQQKIAAVRQADLAQGFDLAKAPLLRAVLLQTADEGHEFLWNFHHILLDGWSMFKVLHEALALYDAFTRGHDLQLSRPRPYRDYIAWLRRQSSTAAEAFWRKNLQGFTAPTPLVTDRLAASKTGEEFASQVLALSDETTRALEAMAQKYHLTLNTLMQGAWALLLSRYSGETDVVFGAIVSGRPADLSGVETMVGLFINTLPVRVQAPPDAALPEWLKKNQTQQAELRQYEYSSLRHVQGWSDAPPGVSLFDSIFMFENYRKDTPLEAMSAALKISNARWFERQNYPLAAIAIPGRPTVLRLTYDGRRFESETIARLLQHWQTLLAGMTDHPTARLSELPLLTSAERQQVLSEWNETTLDYSRDRCAHELFEAQAELRPEAVAVSHQGRTVTYRELNRRANQLAHRLQKMGVGPETLVGICMERSLELVLASLAVLKAGGAYVPLDPAYPQERLAFMLQDSQVPVLLTKKTILKNFQFSIFNLKSICLDEEENLTTENIENPFHQTAPENLAYVIYTSGSTGKPKGVEIPHAGLMNLCAWHQEVYHVTADDRATQFAAPAFDASVWEIWPYLTLGASLHIADEETLTNPLMLLQWLAGEAISICFLPTPIAEAVLEALSEVEGLALRALLVGGDKLHRRPKQTLPFILANNYGPTENTVVTTWTVVASGETDDIACDERSRTAPPIGRPVANTQVYVLDHALQPVPVGVSGELHIGGESLARGYLKRPELVAEKFIPNPLLESQNEASALCALRSARLYATGDLARYLPDGNIEFLGRLDDQVKIRGNRIELGEIETTLLQHPAVREAVCVANAASTTLATSRRLIAYVVAAQNSSTLRDELRRFLAEKLPEYMIPSAFVFLEALPLTTNGKIDRNALPAPEQTQLELEETFAAPRTPLEKTLADIWAEVLGAKKVGMHDNFFELGGDSILTIQIISRANRAGIKITPKQLFSYPTIAALVDVVAPAQIAENEQGLITGALPLTPIQRWFFAQNFVAPEHWNMAMLLEVATTMELSALQQVVQHLLNHHDALRLRFVQTESGWQAQHAPVDNLVPVSRFDLSALPAAEQNAALQARAAELQASLNLSQGPLLRFALFDFGGSTPLTAARSTPLTAARSTPLTAARSTPLTAPRSTPLTAPRAQRLLIIIHHLAVDGVSWRILLEDLETACRQIKHGEKISLPPKTTAFKHWAQRLTELAQSPKLQDEADFWLKQTASFSSKENVAPADKISALPSVGEAASSSRLPVDFAAGREANTMSSARTITVSLNASETQALLQEVPKSFRAQIDEVLLTALARAFAGLRRETSTSSVESRSVERWTGALSLLVDLEGHGREDILEGVDLSRTVGWFTTMFPVRLDLENADAAVAALKQIKEQLRRIPQRGLGFGLLRYLSSTASLASKSHDPMTNDAMTNNSAIPEVSFNYLGQFDQTLPKSSAFKIVAGETGPVCSPQAKRQHLLDVTGMVLQDCLQVEWMYSASAHRRATIENLAENFMQVLRSLMAPSQTAEMVGYTPSDFPGAKLSQKDLDKLLGKIRH